MPAATARMPLRTAQDAPCFRGATDSLFHYTAKVENLCRKCQCATDAKLIKWTVYYADESSWDTFAATRELLDEPKTWEAFKTAIGDLYPQYEHAHAHTPLHASSPLLAAPITPWSPQPPAPALTLSLAALDALLSPALSNMPKAPGLSQLSPTIALVALPPLSPAGNARLPAASLLPARRFRTQSSCILLPY